MSVVSTISALIKRRDAAHAAGQSEAPDPRVAEVIALAEKALPAEEQDAFAIFVSALYAEESAEELDGATAEQLYGAAVSLWRLGAERAPGEAKLRVYDPSSEEHGWRSTHTVVEIVNDDMPFLVRSLTAVFTGRGLGVHLLAHPVFDTPRDPAGRRALGGATVRESAMHIQIDRVPSAEDRAEIEAELATVLKDVRAAVSDWTPMRARLSDVVAELTAGAPVEREELDESVAFLEWLADDHFTLIAARDYHVIRRADGSPTLEPEPDTGLGLMRDPGFMVLKNADGDFVECSLESDAFIDDPAPLQIIKANRRSTIHRTTHLDMVAVKRFDASGAVSGERRILGLFTSVAYARSPVNIPFLRRKVARAIARAGYAPQSHNANALENVLATFPRDELFQISEDDLFEISQGILMLEQRPRTRLFLRQDRYERFVSALLYTTRERFNSELRAKVADMLVEAYQGRLSSFYPSFGDGPLARVQYIIVTRPGAVPEVDPKALEDRAAALARAWTDDLRDALLERHGEAVGLTLHKRYAEAFDASYEAHFRAENALGDIDLLESVAPPDADPLALKFYRRIEDPEGSVRLKLFHREGSIPLSDCLPVLENLGLRVLEERPFEVRVRGGAQIWIHDFLAELRGGDPIDLGRERAKLEDAFAAVWRGRVENDGYNRLVTAAALSADQVAVIRAYARFLRQTGLGLSGAYLQETLARNPVITADLARLFEARFDPNAHQDAAARAAAAESVCAAIETGLEQVASLDEDRILRRFKNAILSTLRTNAFQDPSVRQALAFKFDSQALDDLPLPRPYREIWVYAPQVEGVHLRFGPVARGGLRWSDRREDFRTEVLGLVKAQQVKNAVIVPVGSKGGFFPKQLPAGGARDAVFEAGREAYKVFIGALLDVTDNLSGDAVVPPADVVRHDGDDPYLVVAADKGTATFSDTANAIAEGRGFWLGDAFASGGGHGYDHKAMGITARGAWEAVKRHFRELGTDIQSEPFRVIGVGDMSGDVFGNGMLLSKQIRLVAAFDHRDIFFDPDPDPAKSWDERKRLFETPRTSWKDYDPALISAGGGVFPRSAKSIALTPEIRALTGLQAERATPAEVIAAILKMEADLLWFGGIGTYVKAAAESHADAGDRGNDAIRANAEDLRVRVIGEGANLGITQRARIAFSRAGGRCNTDAVDNSAGVDCSDHEVNIKIALGQVVGDGDMTVKQRNQLLEAMTDEVAALVLKTNYRQTLALTLETVEASQRLEDHCRVMEALEAEGRLNRTVEQLPDEATLADRRAAGEGLARPEIAVLLAYSKIVLFDALVAGDAPDDPAAFDLLLAYMPGPIAKDRREALERHRLRREIIATVLANAMIDEGGIDFARRMVEASGAEAGGVARAFLAARAVFGLPALRDAVNALDVTAPAELQAAMHQSLRRALSAQTARLLAAGAATQPIAETVARFEAPITEIRRTILTTDLDIGEPDLEARAAAWTHDGVSDDLARAIAALPLLEGAVDVAEAAERVSRPATDAAEAWFTLGAALDLDWVRATAEVAPLSDRWDRMALASLMADLRAAQRRMVESALDGRAPAAEAAAAWIAQAGPRLERYRAASAEARRSGGSGVSRLSVLIGALGQSAM
ncbi:MAG: NAD-glutamate dehydrogenase [Pseudomonadota bacterium]